MQEYFGVITIILFITIVIVRSIDLRKQGIQSMEFGKKDRKDFIIIPFALFYFYILTANLFSLPTIPNQLFFYNEIVSWIGVLFCFLALCFFILTMVSFKKSFRVGLVENTSQGLITNGTFTFSRNPIYVSFAIMLIGQFLIFPSWILFVYIILSCSTFHKQVLKEESFLKQIFGKEFTAYSKKVRRYF